MRTVSITAKSKKSNISKKWKKNLVAYFFLSPWFVGILTLSLVPMIISFYFSFTDYDFFSMPQWIGLGNYIRMFTEDHRYMNALRVTSIYVFVGVPLKLIFALLLALVLNRGLRGLEFFRAVYYVPSLLGGSVAIAVLWRQVFGINGIFNGFLKIFGIEGTSWIANPDYALYTLIVLLVWQFGSSMIIFLAGLKQIPAQLYESASIDGSGCISRFIHITLPLLSPIILFNLIMQIISAFQAFTPAYIIGGPEGSPLDSLLFYTLYLYTKGFGHFEMGYASAMAWVLLALIAILTAFIFSSSEKWVYYES